ncbi:MAG: carboxypeptidase regulatory-like domain-containing protein [Candidatus Solibacter usitatus]|nr:carboxypeptidase regulatory-like domain-containing protein [Candidatus Solibacter usitatus]
MRKLRCSSFLLLLASFSVLPAQQLSQLSGLVTDPTGAAIPGASIRLESLTKGIVVREVQTGQEGRYSFPQIAPDRYRIVAKAAGFLDVTVNEVAVRVAMPANYDIAFQRMGAVAESISVTAEATNLNTVDATVGNVITNKTILELPSFARNVAGLLALQPGVNQFGNVNGGKSDQSNITLDGVDVNEQQERNAFQSVLKVTLDSVDEFRTTTSNANADQGRSSGAQIALSTRSGTNELHAAAYWYHRNTATAANGFFNNQADVKQPKLLINIPGFRLGMPIRKNKLFLFFNWEQRNDRSDQNVERVVPSALLRQGSVQYHNRAGAIVTLSPDQVRALDPRGIGANTEILKIFNSYPLPNDPKLGDGLNLQGYRFTAPLERRDPVYISKFDYQAKANHNFFLRAQTQNEHRTFAPQFPGQQPNSLFLANGKGVAAGYTAILSANMISTFRYGLTRYARDFTGIQGQSAIAFRDLDSPIGLTTGVARKMPLHQFSEDISWNKGKHSIDFGTIIRLVDNQSLSTRRSFHSASTNVNWLRGVGSDFSPRDLAPNDRAAFGNAMMSLLGIISEVDANYNYNIRGEALPLGAPVTRNFRNREYELYFKDSWRARKNLTLSYGLRWSLMPPVYEANGVQASTNIPLGDWFNMRGSLADQGKSQQDAGAITYVRAGDTQGRPLYPFHKRNFAPRLSLAWSPSGPSGWKKFLFGGDGRTSIRAGWGMFYDLVGQSLARTFDSNAFGFATTLANPSGRLNATTAPRFTGLFNLPPELIRPAPRGGFPFTPPSDIDTGFAITSSIDDKLKIPYTMNMNFSVGREFAKGWFVEGRYVGRMSRRSLMNRDLAMPANLTDPASKQSYFEGATQMFRLLTANTPVASVTPIPFFENMYSNLKTARQTATQVIYNDARNYGNDFISTLADIDEYCDPGCGRLGANMMMNAQFSSLSAWSSIAGGNYHSMQWSLRKSFSNGLSVDFNYTYAKSQDLASDTENSGEFSGFLVIF